MSRLYLESQDAVALVCTGTPTASEDEPRLVAEYLAQHYGFVTRYQADTYKPLSAAQRAEIFYQYVTDASIKAIWSVRGGEGTADIIPYLEARAAKIKQSTAKLLLGFSDFTPVLVYFQQRYSWPVIHGIGARQLSQRMVNKTSVDFTLNWLRNLENHVEINEITPLNPAANGSITLRAPIIGGNLTLLQLSINDIWQLKPSGNILLIEEVNEEPYKVARTLKYLQRIGFFSGVKAILLAGFDFPNRSARENSDIYRSMQNVLQHFAGEAHCPVLYTAQIGHATTNYPVPFYADASLHLGAKPLLRLTRPPVSG